MRLQLNSDLTGTRIDLPHPIYKAENDRAPLQVVLEPGENLRMKFRYNELVDADLLLAGAAGLQRGHIRLGGLPSALPEEPGVLLNGQLASELIAEDWWLAWQRISRYQSGLAASVQGAADNPLQNIDLTLGEVIAWGMPMGITSVRGQQREQYWDFGVDSDLLRGRIELPHGSGPLRAVLDYLHLPEPEPAADADAGNDSLAGTEPAELPAVDMTIGELFIGGRHWGSWNFSGRPQPRGWWLEIRDADLHGLKLRGELLWQHQQGSHQTTLQGLQFSSDNLGRLQRGLRQIPVIEGREMEGTAEFSWPGSPMAFNIAGLRGAVKLRIRDGALVSEGAGALRAFGVLNVNSMSRRLKLDFSDLYQSGVAFDTLRASARLEDGILTFTEPLIVDGPSGRFQTSGSTSLLDETLNMKLAVTLPVTSSLPMVAVLAGFAPPVAASIYVTEKLIGDELSRFTSTSYDISGTWREPDMKLNRAFDNQVDGSQRRSLKQRIKSIFGLEDN